MAKDNKSGSSKFDTAVKIVSTAKTVANTADAIFKLIKMWGQHPEWYTHYDTHSLVGLNLASKQGITYPDTKVDLPGGLGINYAMPIAAQILIEFTRPTGDLDGYNQGVRLLYQQLRTANSGRINYTLPMLDQYIHNARLAHALCAWLARLYRTTYTFISTNAQVPQDILRAMYLNPDDIIDNAADIFTYTQRYIQQIRLAVPGDMDYFTRARWLMNNVFVDNPTNKSQWYVPTFNFGIDILAEVATGGQFYYVNSYNGNTGGNFGVPTSVVTKSLFRVNVGRTDLFTWEEISDIFNQFRSYLINDPMTSIIAGDIVKAFGDKAFVTFDIPEIDSTLMPVHDEYILSQFQNALVPTDYNPSEVNPFANSHFGYALGIQDDEVLSAASLSPRGFRNSSPDIKETLISRLNKPMVNSSKNELSSGEIMSITRLVPSGVEMDGNQEAILFTIFGSEIVAGVRAIVPTGVEGEASHAYIPIAGLIGPSDTSGNLSNALQAVAFWAYYDWAPRVYLYNGNNDGITTLYPTMWDFNMFAMLDDQRLSTYFSYGDQSLLFAGNSMNQSGSKSYTGASHNNKRSSTASNKSRSNRNDGGGKNG